MCTCAMCMYLGDDGDTDGILWYATGSLRSMVGRSNIILTLNVVMTTLGSFEFKTKTGRTQQDYFAEACAESR